MVAIAARSMVPSSFMISQQTPAGWSAEARAWAEKNGLIAGDEAGNKQYRSFLTREQMAVLMQRYDAMQHGK